MVALFTAIALHRYTASPPNLSSSLTPSISKIAPTSPGIPLPDEFVWAWPEQLGSAAGMFACQPDTARSTRESVVVWTDGMNKVVAYGSARGEAPLASYAFALGPPREGLQEEPINVATEGFVVKTAGRKHTLQVNGTTLACIRTWND
jgi:hypothetical protein